ncbi:acyl-CoA/acyl-ACP dehydrogenase [Acidimicrobiia bacterium EGI L10123]|uniref:acyl-CoA dehydrogenase family protein n=1 Tax=Salinilacustrithrix flava TaxID=2957203 RepID=UPI003D7C2818|nr:acyl-CoA/acyl-ACP dehydrogenase [Acidimicrobiia bacterium EGI L10123]
MDKVLDRAHEVAHEVAAPAAEAVDAEARWPEASLRALQEAGLGGLVVPERDGGLGHGLATLAQVCEILGAACASTAMCFGMHGVGSAVIAAKATEEQQERYLEPIVAGRHLTTLTLSEPGTGSHFWLPQSELRRTDDGFVLSGTKTFVTSGAHADSYVVSAVDADATSPIGEFSCVVVDATNPGLEWGPSWDGLGMRGNSSRSVELRGVQLPEDALLGEPGDQIWYVFNVIAPYFLMAMSGSYLGVAAGAFEDMRLHVTQRRYSHDGSRLAEQPVIQHRVGELWAELERTRQLVRHAANGADRGEPWALPALASAKAEVAECATRVVNGAMTLVGGIGYREHGSLGRRMRDARAAHVMAPTTDLLRLWTGRAILDEHILAD